MGREEITILQCRNMTENQYDEKARIKNMSKSMFVHMTVGTSHFEEVRFLACTKPVHCTEEEKT